VENKQQGKSQEKKDMCEDMYEKIKMLLSYIIRSLSSGIKRILNFFNSIFEFLSLRKKKILNYLVNFIKKTGIYSFNFISSIIVGLSLALFIYTTYNFFGKIPSFLFLLFIPLRLLFINNITEDMKKYGKYYVSFFILFFLVFYYFAPNKVNIWDIFEKIITLLLKFVK